MCSRPSSAGSTGRSNPRLASRGLCRLAGDSTGRRRIRPDRFEVENQQDPAPTSSSSVVSGVSLFLGRKLGRELASIRRIRNNDRPNRLSPGAQHAERELTRNDQRVYARARVAVKRVAPKWHPHQLRHNAATRLRREFGLDVARAVLGHSSPVVTEVYAELDQAKAAEAMAKIG